MQISRLNKSMHFFVLSFLFHFLFGGSLFFTPPLPANVFRFPGDEVSSVDRILFYRSAVHWALVEKKEGMRAASFIREKGRLVNPMDP